MILYLHIMSIVTTKHSYFNFFMLKHGKKIGESKKRLILISYYQSSRSAEKVANYLFRKPVQIQSISRDVRLCVSLCVFVQDPEPNGLETSCQRAD